MGKQLDKIQELIERREKARLGGGEKAIAKQHEKGKFTARERINMLLDEGSFEELDMFVQHRCTNFGMEKKTYDGDGVVTGFGTVGGRLVYVFAQDATVIGGSLGETMALKMCKVMDLAMKQGAPVIGLNDSGGARIQESVNALAGYAEIFQRNINASGVIPQISAILGPCAGGAVYSPALTDFIIMAKGISFMFLTGPKVVKTVTGENVTQEQLGGAGVHASKSGVAHFAAETEEEAIAIIRQLLSYMPSNNMEETPRVECTDPIDRVEDALNSIIPESANDPYDMYEVIQAIVDNGEFLEVQPKSATVFRVFIHDLKDPGTFAGKWGNRNFFDGFNSSILKGKKRVSFVKTSDFSYQTDWIRCKPLTCFPKGDLLHFKFVQEDERFYIKRMPKGTERIFGYQGLKALTDGPVG